VTDQTPKDGDFAGYLERRETQDLAKGKGAVGSASPESTSPGDPEASGSRSQTLEDVLVHGEEPTDEFIEGLTALEGAEPLSDEELEQQALQDPGGDGDPQTPE
jgi:hypothetical protein